jgi:hypothetical protein
MVPGSFDHSIHDAFDRSVYLGAMSAVAGIVSGVKQRFPQSRELIKMLPKSEVSLQRGKERLLDLRQSRIASDCLPSECETGTDQSFLPHHLAGNIVIAPAVGDAATDYLAGVV